MSWVSGRLFSTLTAVALLGALSFGTAAAQTGWPRQPIKLVVGFSAGGPTDVFARVLAKRLSDQLDQRVLIENRPGANANIAADAVVRAAPDGYTFLYNSSSLAISAGLYNNLTYDARKDLLPVALVMSLPTMLVAAPTVPVATPADFVSYVSKRAGQVNYGSGGAGNAQHLGMEMILRHFNLQATHIAYKGSPQVHVDLLSGRVEFMVDGVTSVLPYVKDNRLKPIAVLGLERSPELPGVPTMHESGMPGFALEGWYGVMAPLKTPEPIVRRMAEEIRKAMDSEEVKASLATLGGRSMVGGPDALASYLKEEIDRYAAIIKAIDLKPE